MVGFEMKLADRIYISFLQKFFKQLGFNVEMSCKIRITRSYAQKQFAGAFSASHRRADRRDLRRR